MNRFKYRPTVAVCGATGQQGGAVVNSLLESGKYQIRALTRNGTSDKANYLRDRGVEIVTADFDQPETLVKAFQDCQLAFLVTNFWEHMDAKREYRQGCALMDAVETAGIIHVVWSTLEDTRVNKYNDEIPFIGDYKVAHFDEKGRITEYAKTKRFQRTDLYTSFYYENFLTTMKLSPDKDGIRRLYLPIGNRPIPMVSINDIGQMVVKVLDQGILGEVGVSSEHLTGQQITERLSDATGKSYEYVAISPSEYRNLGFPGCQELGNMFEFKSCHNGDFCHRRHLNQVTQHYSPEHFMSWCQKHCGKLLTETPG
jgi:uncharacterized protein YbjT (DUF2867 family)